jgi:hypothetical protein
MEDVSTEKKHSSLTMFYDDEIKKINEKLIRCKSQIKHFREMLASLKGTTKKRETIEKNIAKNNSLMFNLQSQLSALITEQDEYITGVYPTFFPRSRSLMFGEFSKHQKIIEPKQKRGRITVKKLRRSTDVGDLLVDKYILKRRGIITSMVDPHRYFREVSSQSSILKCNSCDFGCLVEGDGYYYCPKCFSTHFDVLESSSTITSEESTKKEKRNNDYKKIKRFMIWLSEIQGKVKVVDELETLIERVSKKISDDGMDIENITTNYLLNIFKQMKTFEFRHKTYQFNDYYNYIPYIYSKLSGYVLPSFTEQELEALRMLFSEFIYWFHEVENKNSVIYSHVTTFLLKAIDREDAIELIGQISDEDKLQSHRRTSELILKKAREHREKMMKKN